MSNSDTPTSDAASSVTSGDEALGKIFLSPEGLDDPSPYYRYLREHSPVHQSAAGAIFLTLKSTIGLRVSAEEELEGLDISEHGMHAYDLTGSPGFAAGNDN